LEIVETKGKDMTRWEYTVVLRTRQFQAATVGGAFNVGDFSPNGDHMMELLARMGRERWELVNISNRATMHPSPLTTEEMWVVKRPLDDT
jgi:hypothetical protein